MNKIAQIIQKSKVNELNGKSLKQQSLENYIEETLNMSVINVVSLENNEFKFTAEKDGTQYIFISDYLTSYIYTARENFLTLIEIKDNENKLEVHEEFYLTKQNESNNKNNLYITTPLDKLMNGVLEDPEIKIVIDYLKNKFEEFNYEYEEASKGNLMTFSITINNQIVIEPGFSNTIEVRFKDKNFKSVHIIYRDTDKRKIKSQLDKLCSLIDDYFNWNISFNDMSVSKLYDYLRRKNYYLMVNTPYFMEELTEDFPIFDTFVIEDRHDEYKQVEVSIMYKPNLNKFELIANYLLKEVKYLCNNVDEIINIIEEIEDLVK